MELKVLLEEVDSLEAEVRLIAWPKQCNFELVVPWCHPLESHSGQPGLPNVLRQYMNGHSVEPGTTAPNNAWYKKIMEGDTSMRQKRAASNAHNS